MSDERSEQTIRPIQALFDYFNSRFELYGRRLVLVPVPYPSSSNPVGLRAAAAEVAAQGIFAAFEPSIGTFDPAWFNELARQQVIGITSNMWSFLSDRETYDPLHPYVWGVHPSMEQMWNNLASLACSSLVGRPASHAGSAYTSTTRKFGILSAGNERAPSVSSLTSQLSACGADVVTTSWVSRRDGSAGRATALNKLRDSGVTTFICACANQVTYGIGPAVDNMGWEPEWIFTGLTSPVFDEYLHQFGLPERQRAHLFGIQPLGMVGPQQSQWWWRAIVEAGVADVASSLPSIQRHVNGVYEQLLVLASGIQAAGPQLDASSFGQGLLSTSFPNTGAGAAPHFQESVGFGPGDHSLNSDFALVWWSMTATPFGAYTEAPRGSWCYLSGATRFKPGNYPTNADGLFFRTDLPCR